LAFRRSITVWGNVDSDQPDQDPAQRFWKPVSGKKSTMPAISYRRASSFLYPLILLVIAVPAWAEVYTWQDETGQQRFSDRPPESRDYQRWEPPENPNSDLQLPEPRAHSPVVSGNDDEDERRSNARSEKLRQDKQCREYEAELERINNQLRAGYREPKGNRLRAKRRRLRSREFNECM